MANLEQFLIEAEGFERKVYKDSAGKSTIGVGHLLSKSERDSGLIRIGADEIPYKDGLSTLQVMALLDQDLNKYEAAVKDSLKLDVTDGQYIALVSFCFNVGIKAFQESTLLKRLNEYRFERIPYEFMRWIYIGGHIDKGLIRRRTKELVMWLS